MTLHNAVFALGFEGMGSRGPHSFVKVGFFLMAVGSPRALNLPEKLTA